MIVFISREVQPSFMHYLQTLLPTLFLYCRNVKVEKGDV